MDGERDGYENDELTCAQEMNQKKNSDYDEASKETNRQAEFAERDDACRKQAINDSSVSSLIRFSSSLLCIGHHPQRSLRPEFSVTIIIQIDAVCNIH